MLEHNLAWHLKPGDLLRLWPLFSTTTNDVGLIVAVERTVGHDDRRVKVSAHCAKGIQTRSLAWEVQVERLRCPPIDPRCT